jgi:hypothetical protein
MLMRLNKSLPEKVSTLNHHNLNNLYDKRAHQVKKTIAQCVAMVQS